MRRRLLIAGAILLGLLATAFAAGSADRCGTWPAAEPSLTAVSRSEGPLLVGAAKVELRFAGAVTVGGYGPWRSTATSAASPLYARALVLDVGGQRLGLVLLDVLLVAPRLRDRIAHGLAHPAWVLATHTHSGPGGYDTRPAAQLAGLGAFDPAVEAVLVDAARKALAEAGAALLPGRLHLAHTGPAEGADATFDFSVARSGAAVDGRVTSAHFSSGERRLADLQIVSAHPTLVEKRTAHLDPDWPGAIAARREANGGPLTLVVQGAGGNASVNRAHWPTVEAAAGELTSVFAATEHFLSAQAVLAPPPASVKLAWSEVRVGLPRPDASRLVPRVAKAFAENLLCDGAEDVAVLHGLRLDELTLLFVPFEPSYAAGLVLEEQARVARVVSLTDGYAGYVETVEAASAGTGEAGRQYYPPELLTRLAEGARLAGDALGR